MTKTQMKEMKMMIDFEKIFTSFANNISGSQFALDVKSGLHVYYGVNSDGCFRIAFRSSKATPKMQSTKLLDVVQGYEGEGVYWTCFDLLTASAKKVFFAFCANLIEAIENIDDEKKAGTALKNRYLTWKTMFKKEFSGGISMEVLQGLFGELYFMKKYMLSSHDIDTTIRSWSGPDLKSKDFSVGDTWYEVKTIGANSTQVHISSLAQLSSDYVGKLAIIRTERMSDEFSNGDSSVGELFEFFTNEIKDEILEGIFLSKISSYGVDPSDEAFKKKFDVKSMEFYRVDDNFPRLRESDVKFDEIGEIRYTLLVNPLNKYKEN